MDDATKYLLTEAREEIVSLRRRNELLSAKVEMIDLFSTVLHTRPAGQAQGMALDVAWKIDRALADDIAKQRDAQMHVAEEMAQRQRPERTSDNPLGLTESERLEMRALYGKGGPASVLGAER